VAARRSRGQTRLGHTVIRAEHLETTLAGHTARRLAATTAAGRVVPAARGHHRGPARPRTPARRMARLPLSNRARQTPPLRCGTEPKENSLPTATARALRRGSRCGEPHWRWCTAARPARSSPPSHPATRSTTSNRPVRTCALSVTPTPPAGASRTVPPGSVTAPPAVMCGTAPGRHLPDPRRQKRAVANLSCRPGRAGALLGTQRDWPGRVRAERLTY
jgi:hypothetical protein